MPQYLMYYGKGGIYFYMIVTFYRLPIFTGSSGCFKYIEPGIELMVTMISKIIWITSIIIRWLGGWRSWQAYGLWLR